MSLIEQQNLLARLYTDADIRRRFLFEPDKIGAQFSLSESEIREIAAIMPEELEFFADSLFWKRLREAEKFLPLTRRVLGGKFVDHFREFSQGFNPKTVKKHFEDALAFSRALLDRNISPYAKNVARFERSRLRFFGHGKRLAICRLDYDLREFFSDPSAEEPIAPEKRRKLAIWIKVGKRIGHFYI